MNRADLLDALDLRRPDTALTPEIADVLHFMYGRPR